jgi:tripartite-type tricarboxylate transporter receptor subunit TctC
MAMVLVRIAAPAVMLWFRPGYRSVRHNASGEASSWFGLVAAPAKTPPDAIKTLTETVMKVLRDPDLAKQLADVGAEPGSLSGSEFGAFLHAEADKWSKVVRDAGVVMQ